MIFTNLLTDQEKAARTWFDTDKGRKPTFVFPEFQNGSLTADAETIHIHQENVSVHKALSSFLKHFSLEPPTERYLSESTFAHPDGQHRQANALPEHSRLFKPDSNGVNTWIPIIYEKRLLEIQFLSVSPVSVGTVRWERRRSGHLVQYMEKT